MTAEARSPQSEPLKILIVRPDRLGDVILSTPVFEAVKRHYPNSHITLLVRENVVPLLKGLPSVDAVMTFDPNGRHSGLKGSCRLLAEIKQQRFQTAIVLQSHRKIALLLFLARIPTRVGPLSKPHSYLFYNKGLRQRRSQVEMHEADYNLQLLRKLGIRAEARNIPVQVDLNESVRNLSSQTLLGLGWSPAKPTVVVHPGMGGSALNWPESSYTDLIRELALEGRQVVVTTGPEESQLSQRIQSSLESIEQKVIFFKADLHTPIDLLAGVFSHASVVIAPSTGPLHLAVALGKPVVTFYPPIRVQSAVRWGPYLKDDSRASVLVPQVYCGQDFTCLGSACNYFPCMESLTVKQALGEVHRQLTGLKKE